MSQTGAMRGSEARPVSRDEAAALFDELKSYELVVLAVSGGADSVCLMRLVCRWLADNGGHSPRVEIATVDHGLRAESSEEARWVGEQAKLLGLPHSVLVWSGEKPKTGIQDAARRARYELLSAYARRGTPSAVVTAHTQDDQAETFLMRLARGSGLDGLAAMPARRSLRPDGAVQLVRPLLGVAKARLVATLDELGQKWIEDPSNDMHAFERVRLRKAWSALEEIGLTGEKIALSAERLGRARDALDESADAFRHALVELHDGIYASFSRNGFNLVSREVRVRVLSSLLQAFGGSSGIARLAQVEMLESALSSGADLAQTLGGCLVSAGSKTVRIYREPSGRDLPEIEFNSLDGVIWDERFEVSLDAEARARVASVSGPLVVRALGGRAYATLRSHLERRHPSRPASSLPAIWSHDRLVGVPDLIWPQATFSEDLTVSSCAPILSFKARFLPRW
jgi:tRNA(Ile)-lysidine synthase